MIYKNVLELIGNTPIVELESFSTKHSRIFMKLESQNPGGSIKDRIGLSMINHAEKEGKIKPGDTLIEATAGNTGLGLALVAAKKGYKLICVIPDKMNHDVDAIVVGVGSAGTIGGLTRYFRKTKPALQIVLADPEGSVLKDYFYTGQTGQAGSWFVEGIGEDFVPAQCDFSLVTHAYSVTDEEAFKMAGNLLKSEGILAGSSTGVLLAAALKYASEQTSPKKILTFACDTGNKYLTKMFDDQWLTKNGF